MTKNLANGDFGVELGDKTYNIRFDWGCIAKIEAVFGVEPNYFNPDVIAGIAAIGFEKNHPELTAERIKEISPPLLPFVKAVQEALQFAYFGNSALPKDDDAEKKSLRRKRLLKLLRRP